MAFTFIFTFFFQHFLNIVDLQLVEKIILIISSVIDRLKWKITLQT